MSWETQGRQYHGYFGDGRSGTTAKQRSDRPAAPVIEVMDRRQLPSRSQTAHHAPRQHQASSPPGAAATADLHERNVEDLARVIKSEANGRPLVEQTAVGQIHMNRLHRAPPGWTVEQVWGAFSHKTSPDDAQRALARDIIDGKVADISKGATHFYSPQRMPRKGNPTKGFDVGGGLEQSATPSGIINNYRPGFTTTFPSVTIPGVDPMYFRIYQQPGNGHVR